MAYTVQQIKAALKLYDRLKKVVPTVRQLGYPYKVSSINVQKIIYKNVQLFR